MHTSVAILLPVIDIWYTMYYEDDQGKHGGTNSPNEAVTVLTTAI